jgi:hypothetical protein
MLLTLPYRARDKHRSLISPVEDGRRVCRIQASVTFSIHFLFVRHFIKRSVTCDGEFEDFFH